jgi:spore coat protein CotF
VNNKISNPKPNLPTGMNLNDKDIIMALLTCLKELEKNYVYALEEASCENLFHKHQEKFSKIVSMQREVYETMFRLGFYELEAQDKNKISEKYNMLNQEYNSLQ